MNIQNKDGREHRSDEMRGEQAIEHYDPAKYGKDKQTRDDKDKQMGKQDTINHTNNNRRDSRDSTSL